MSQFTIGYYCNAPKQYRLSINTSLPFHYNIVNSIDNFVTEIEINYSNSPNMMQSGIHEIDLTPINSMPPFEGIGVPKLECQSINPVLKYLTVFEVFAENTTRLPKPPMPYDKAQHKG